MFRCTIHNDVIPKRSEAAVRNLLCTIPESVN
jgi:hypothetical protein